MRCRMLRGIYLRANGEINCYCSTGETLVLGQVPLDDRPYNFVEDIYKNQAFRHIRESFAKDKLPYPNHCLKCNYLDIWGKADLDKLDHEIEWLHAESAYACNLRCSFCDWGSSPKKEQIKREPPYMLPEKVWNKVLSDIHDAGLKVRWMYFNGQGEPVLHPGIWDMVATAKDMFETNFLVNTNGNARYSDKICESRCDKVKIAIENTTSQEEYARYRVRGKLKKVLDFTKKVADYKERHRLTHPEIIWQKIMFDFSDSDEELIEFQNRALENGVNKVRIIYTFTENYSTKSPEDLPRIHPSIEIISVFDRDNQDGAAIRDSVERLSGQHSLEMLEENMELINKIFFWCKNGVPNRDAYNAFGKMKISDPENFALRAHNPHLDVYWESLRQALYNVSGIYDEIGLGEQAKYYRREAEHLKKPA